MDVLLVEDNPHDAELAMMAMQRARYAGKVIHVDDGVKAVDYLLGTGAYAANPPQLPRVVFLDLKLPKLDGIEVLRRIKGDARVGSVPVVMLTSSRELSDIAECYRLGVNSYIVKPVNFDEYQRMIAQLIAYWTEANQRPIAPTHI